MIEKHKNNHTMYKLIIALLLPFSALTQPTRNQTVESKIDKVTVFVNGASIVRSAKISLTTGRTELVFQGISPQIDKQSIQLKAEGKFTILSVVHQLSNGNEKSRQEEIAKQEALKADLEEKIRTERNNQLVYKREEELLLKNQNVGGTYAGLKVADLKEAADFQRNRMQEALNKQLEIERNIKKIDKEIQKINQQLTLLTVSQDKTTSEIVVTVSAKENILEIPFSLSYFVQNAGWTPTYDLRVENIAQPLHLAYKANVYQYSGEDWKNVKLSLSTANPKKSGTAPQLQTWLLPFKNNYSHYYNQVNSSANQSLTQVSGQIRSGNEPIPGVSVQLKGTKFGTVSNANGFYFLNIPPDFDSKAKTLVFSVIGYTNEEVAISSDRQDVTLHEAAQQLQEVVVVGYGTQKREDAVGAVSSYNLEGRSPGIAIRGTSSINDSKSQIPIELEEKEAPTSQSFDILVPYQIPSDGKVYTVEIKEEEIPALYEHYCVPKIDPEVFLSAKILNWERYKLLNGEANLFFEGTFLGKSTLNLSNSDTLQVWLGRDKNVIVTRTKLKDFQKKQLVGGNKFDTRNFEIVVRNTKKQAITMILEDQFPLSKLKDIMVEDTYAPEAKVNAENGKITWRFSLESTKDKKLTLGYTIKSPKSGMIDVE
jgi:hypothetical protein